jgi:rhamnose transport system ATP-binding protein
VLRDGRRIDTVPVSEVNRESLIRMMVGRDTAEVLPENGREDRSQRVMLEVRNLTRAGAFRDVSFSLHDGEILGMAGLVGAGRSEVARAIFGIDRPDSGTILVEGRDLPPGSVETSMRYQVVLVPEDRQHQGLILPMSICDNLVLPIQHLLVKCGLRSTKRERATAERLVRELDVRAQGIHVPAESLSGGNQQKLVLGKWLATSPHVLILDEPTRGIDVGAKAEIHRRIRELARNGMAILFISSDLPEILLMSDRVIVMRAGEVAGEFSRGDATQERILELALLPGRAECEAVAPAAGMEAS